MQAFSRSKHRLTGREAANILQITVNLTFKNSMSSNSKILSHVGLVWLRNEGKVCGSFFEECKSKLTESRPECLSIHTQFAQCMQTNNYAVK